MPCQTCSYWTPQNQFGQCTKILPKWELEREITQSFIAQEKMTEEDSWALKYEWPEHPLQKDFQSRMAQAKAYVVDGSSYIAELWTAPDFECNLHKERL
jgi:hypothetical protein